MYAWTRVLCTIAFFLMAQSVFGQQQSAPSEPVGDPLSSAARLAEVERLLAIALERIGALEAQLSVAPGAEAPGDAAAPGEVSVPLDASAPSVPPITIVSGAGGKNFLNLSLDGLFAAGTSTASDVGALQLGGHDPVQRGFTVQNVETVFSGAVDPYFRGQANVILLIDAGGETVVELEEVYATSTSLPMSLQLKAGQFFTQFGRPQPRPPP